MPVGMRTPAVLAALAGPVPAEIKDKWIAIAEEHSRSGDYVKMLVNDGSVQYPYAGNDYAVAVVNLSQHASILESGHAGFHLPSRWTKWKVGKKGNRYAHVAFRHMTPFAGDGRNHPGGTTTLRARREMPRHIYARAVKLRSGQRLTGVDGLPDRSRTFDPFKNQWRQQSKSYEYYRQLYGDLPEELSGVQGYTWKASKYEGLSRHTDVTPEGGRHTTYSTVRTITPDSDGWYIPPKPGYRIAERAMEAAAPKIRKILEEAVARDVAAMMNHILEDIVL